MFKKYGTHLILLSVLLAILLGVFTPSLFGKISFIGDIFINLLKLFALPLISSALIAAIGGMGENLGQLKSLAKSTVTYMIISEVIAVTITLILFNIFKPGVGLSPNLIPHGADYQVTNENKLSLSNFLVSIFPHNIFNSLAHFELLQVVVFSILFGIGCALVGEKSKPAIHFFVSIREISHTCLSGVMNLAPFGIFALVGAGVAQSKLSGNLTHDFEALLGFVLVLFVCLILHGLWQFALVLFVSKQKAKTVFQQSIPVFTTAFATSSSVATLPAAMETATALKADPNAIKFVLPLCTAINIGGMMMYEVAATLFFTQVLGFHLSLGFQILTAFMCILGGMAEGGIPETSLVSLVMVFKVANIPLSAISILLPLDRIIDRFRTMVNIFGNLCGVIIISKFIKKNYEEIPESECQEFMQAVKE